MQDKYTINKATRFTIVYHDVRSDLGIDFNEYLVLDVMVRYSRKNTYTKGVAYLGEYLSVTRNVIYSIIKKLIKKEHLEKDESTKFYQIHYDVADRMKIKTGNYVVIYENWKELGTDSINRYVFLYLVYSLSRRNRNGTAFSGKKLYFKNAILKIDNFNKMTVKLEEKKLIKKIRIDEYKLTNHVFRWFKHHSNETV